MWRARNCSYTLLFEEDRRQISRYILWVDSWGVKNVFKSNNGVSYEVLSTVMYKLLTQPQLDSGISFERYSTTKKCFGE